jgi:hypothetical protein
VRDIIKASLTMLKSPQLDTHVILYRNSLGEPKVMHKKSEPKWDRSEWFVSADDDEDDGDKYNDDYDYFYDQPWHVNVTLTARDADRVCLARCHRKLRQFSEKDIVWEGYPACIDKSFREKKLVSRD